MVKYERYPGKGLAWVGGGKRGEGEGEGKGGGRDEGWGG